MKRRNFISVLFAGVGALFAPRRKLKVRKTDITVVSYADINSLRIHSGQTTISLEDLPAHTHSCARYYNPADYAGEVGWISAAGKEERS